MLAVVLAAQLSLAVSALPAPPPWDGWRDLTTGVRHFSDVFREAGWTEKNGLPTAEQLACFGEKLSLAAVRQLKVTVPHSLEPEKTGPRLDAVEKWLEEAVKDKCGPPGGGADAYANRMMDYVRESGVVLRAVHSQAGELEIRVQSREVVIDRAALLKAAGATATVVAAGLAAVAVGGVVLVLVLVP